MRVFAISDIHVDFGQNRRWLGQLSRIDYQHDVLILAGDISNDLSLIEEAFVSFKKRFADVLFVPGNHDLWVHQDGGIHSFQKLHRIVRVAEAQGVHMRPRHFDALSIVPLYGWYDYSFGEPAKELSNVWMDFFACRWPAGYDELKITGFFAGMNEPFLHTSNKSLVSFSHFLPRIDLMPPYIPPAKRKLYPMLGSSVLEEQIRRLGSDLHVYGHSHVNNQVRRSGVLYINNAFGYPYETHIATKALIPVLEVSPQGEVIER